MAVDQKVYTAGVNFTRKNGELLSYCGFTEFSIFHKFINRQDIQPIFDDRNSVLSEIKAIAAQTGDGAWVFPVLRVFGMMHNIAHFDPMVHTDYYTAARAFVDFAAVNGFYVQFEIFADAQIIMPDRDAQRKHASNLYAVFHDCNTVLISKGNEWSKNGFYPPDIPNPPDEFTWTQGSDVGGMNPILGGKYSCFHGTREAKKVELSSADLMWVVGGWVSEKPNQAPLWAGTHQPTIHDEPIGFDEITAGNRTSDTRLAKRLAADATMYGAGGTFHSTDGVFSNIFRPVTRVAAQAWCMGIAKEDPVQRYQGV